MSTIADTLKQREVALTTRYNDKVAQLRAQLKAVEAREKLAERKLDTRRKIILGALCGRHVEKNPGSEFAKKVDSLIEEYVIKPNERVLFGLVPLSEEEYTRRQERQVLARGRNKVRGDW